MKPGSCVRNLLALLAAGAIVPLASPALSSMQLGVNTHFEQGWPIGLLQRGLSSKAQGIRDALTWGHIETTAGSYNFTPQNSGYLNAACRANVSVLLVIVPRNKLYDGGAIVSSSQGQAAFAQFVSATVKRFPCIAALEIGNEINGGSRVGPAVSDNPAIYVSVLRQIRGALRESESHAALLGGSSLSVATGFLERLFSAGMLPLVDGVAVHPYRNVPEQLPVELDRLKAAMNRHGGVKPIWASEFGLYYPTPDAAPPHALKVMTILSAAGVTRADWYVLEDEKWFPNMGLYAGDSPKPANDTFRLTAAQLLSAGNARRIDNGDPLAFIYRFGNGPYVMWGTGQSIRFTGSAGIMDARGKPLGAPNTLGPEPIVVDGSAQYSLGSNPVVADTLPNYAQQPWSHFVVNAGGGTVPLNWIDWKYTSYIGSPALDRFRAMSGGVSVGGASANPSSLVERYTAPRAGAYQVSACFSPNKDAVVSVRISHNGQQLYNGVINAATLLQPIPVTLGANESIDIAYRGAPSSGGGLLRRRIRILTQGSVATALCAPTEKGGE